VEAIRNPMAWESIAPDVWRHRDSCNVHAVRVGAGIIRDDVLVESWDGSRKKIDRTNPRIEVRLEYSNTFLL